MGAGWSEVGVEGVPLELVYRVLRHVSLRDLTTLSATSKYLRNLIDESPLLWSHVHTKELWPNKDTWHWFERAAHCGNVGASIKLAVALLYSEGVILGKPVLNGELAVRVFERLETSGTLGPRLQLWLLYRPPWGSQPLCCKRYVHIRVSHIAQMTGCPWAIRVLSRISEVVGDGRNLANPPDVNWIKIAAQGGDTHARLLQWRSRYERRHLEGVLDPGTELQASRELRELCLTGYYPAVLLLSHFLATSRHPSNQCFPEIREFLQNSPPSRTWYALNYQRHVRPHMHHVLVDWLCEVATMKLHTSQVLHAATQIVEAYLSVEQVECNQLQLVGITAILLATRFIPGASMLTIREASWITDNTYSYNHVVRTIGHIMAALKANLALPTILDYATVLLESVKAPTITQEWTRFLCDLATTCSFPPRTTVAQIGSSCVLLGYILSRSPWPNLPIISGFTQFQLLQPALILYCKNFDIEDSKCQRHGIIDRYSLAAFSTEQVGLLPVLPLEDLLASLSLSESDYLRLVTLPPNVRDDIRTSKMDADTASATVMCSERMYRPQQLQVEKPLQRLFCQQDEPLHQELKPCFKGTNKEMDFVSVGNSSVCASDCWAVIGGTAEASSGAHIKPDDSRMEYSNCDLTQEPVSGEISLMKETSSLRTGVCSAFAGERVSSRPYSLNENNCGNLAAAVHAQEQTSSNEMNPKHRHFESPDDKMTPSDVMLDSLSETTDSEENSDILPPTCEGGGAKYTRVNLKRKLENASGSERSEKCLILDVGNLQLS
ncbi:cyclin-F-like [Homarus americanus]|uniref:Cyclin-F-like n=1 Tax=Homarus americanus TaxID=6706 RepID=A0A8J5MLN7_HOMAM|nr:cyclin-F-like [Homarus americanus]KAG7155976.1 cyclin-F-like [Homarus americanus]